MLDFLIYLFVMSISPGPNPILSMANAAAVGLIKGIRLNFGMLTGIAFVTAIDFIIAFFLYSYVPNSYVPKAETAIRILTFIYLMYLAWKMFRKGDLSTDKKGATFREGMLLQLVNAKVYMMALTCLVSYIFPMTESLAEAVLLSLLIPITCFITGLVWAVGGSLLSSLYNSHRRAVCTVLALSLVYCAIRLFW